MADRKLFGLNHESPEGTIADPSMSVAYGKTGSFSFNITWTGILTWLSQQLGTTFLKRADNLSTLTDKTASRVNLLAANRYCNIYNWSGGAGVEANPLSLLVSGGLDKWDLIILPTVGWYRLPTVFQDPSILSGKRIILKNTSGSLSAIDATNTEYAGTYSRWNLSPYSSMEFIYNQSTSTWMIIQHQNGNLS